MAGMTEIYEPSTSTVERIPTYDAFGDRDEALQWVLERIVMKADPAPGAITVWWQSANEGLGGRSPEQVWDTNENELIAFVA